MREETEPGAKPRYRAVTKSGNAQSTGSTAGEALDALTAQLPEEERTTLVVVQEMRPDRYFTEAQIARLRDLMNKVQQAPDSLSEAS